MAKAGVRAIVCVYGSWIGSDLFGAGRLDEAGGLKRGYSRGIPGLESLLSLLRPTSYQLPFQNPQLSPPFSNEDTFKSRIDDLVGETGNITANYINTLENGLNQGTSASLPCLRYLWSSRHHHIGRVESTLDFLNFLAALSKQFSLDSGHRLLVLGFGHAGHVLTLLSNFLASGESSSREMLIDTLESYYAQDQDHTPIDAIERLRQVISHLNADDAHHPVLDIVTFGTPVRYGWDTSGIHHLLHIVNHRPIRSDGKHWLAKMDLPQVTYEMPALLGGDYVQQLAVAGTDTVPSATHEQEVNATLQELLEPYDGFERWLECARRVTRCANDGHCVLIDYQHTHAAIPSSHLFGHACYTTTQAMLDQTVKIVEHLYS